MSRTIFKYRLDGKIGTPFVTPLPRLAQILHIAMQDHNPCLWALIDNEEPLQNRSFVWIGTGHEVPNGHYLATIQNEQYVWHLFEVPAA